MRTAKHQSTPNGCRKDCRACRQNTFINDAIKNTRALNKAVNVSVPRNDDSSERECSTCHKLIYNKKEGCPDVSCVANHRAALIKAAKKVLRNWTTNKLAESVRGLAETLRDIRKEGGKL